VKILLITASLPYPPHQGGALRTYGILQGLHQAGHELRLLSFHDPASTIQVKDTPLVDYFASIETVSPPIRSTVHRLRDLVLSAQPDIARRLYSNAFVQCLKELIDRHEFDLIQFEGIEVACYLPIAHQLTKRPKLCYNAFNAEAALQQMIFEVDREDVQRWPAAAYSFIQSGRIAHFERELCQQADLVLAVSGEDAAILKQYRPDRSVSVVANGVFADEYGKPGEALDLGAAALVFTGKMDYRPNIDAALWFANEVLPKVQGQIPEVKFYIVGQKPHPKLDGLRDKPGVAITGWVNDIQPFLRGTKVYVAPLRMGSGTRLKILEAMAAGCAVVATTIAASGMNADSRNGLLIADTPSEMTSAITTLLRHPAQGQELGAAAQKYVRQNYDWSVIIPHLLSAYRAIGLG
jgi:polysaccharide biosynthesis protein PslH